MKNLARLIELQERKQYKDILAGIRKIENSDATKLEWYLNNLLPAGKQKSTFKTVVELKSYLIDRLEKRTQKRILEQTQRLVFSDNLQPIENITITVDWKKSQMWGMNPNAETFVYGLGHLKSGSIGGCGYDKLSTAVANVLNQIPQFLQLMYELKNKHSKLSNRELFGYGSGYGILPSFEGGVGVSCYDRIFNAIGYEFKTVSSGKTFDVYSVVKVDKKEAAKKRKALYNYAN